MSQDEFAARRFLFALLVASLVLVCLVAWPFAKALFMAAVLAVVLTPVQTRLSRLLRGRPQVAAALLVVAVLLLVVGPILAMSAAVVREATDGVRFLLEIVRSEGMNGLLQRMPDPLDDYAARALADLGDFGAAVESQIRSHGPKAASAVGAAMIATGSLIFQLAMMLIALFFLLTSGRELVAWIDSVLPLRRGQTRELLAEFRKVSYSVIVSTVITAGVQTLAALAGYLIAGVPRVMFFTGLTFFIALIPAIGAAVVCLVAALVLLATGKPNMALFLAVWGVAVVGVVDNVAKPYLMKGHVEMHGVVVFFALIGGVAAFGMVGLLVGPLAVAMLLALLRMYHRDYIGKS